MQTLKLYKIKAQTITRDNGNEFADHQEYTKALDVDIKFLLTRIFRGTRL